MSDTQDVPSAGVPPAVRAQLLATEHWSLLATRSQTWSELMSRITLHLTFTSATLVTLALVAQISGFNRPFLVLAAGLSGAVLLLGTLTLVRVYNGSNDDLALVIGMNRLRGAYIELDPGLAQYLVTGHGGGVAAADKTYTMFGQRGLSQFFGGLLLFVLVINALVAGVFTALVATAFDLPGAAVAAIGCTGGLAYLAVSALVIARQFSGSYPEYGLWGSGD